MSIQWRQYDGLTIKRDPEGIIWHTGRLNDVLPLPSGDLLVAAETGGVWIIPQNDNPVPLSDSWASPDIECLAHGPDGPNHVFAGGGTRLSLASTEVIVSAPDRLDLFAAGQDRALWYMYRSAQLWSRPELLGGDILGSPSVCSWANNRIDVFVVGTDLAVYHKWWDGSRWFPLNEAYERLGGSVVGSPCAITRGTDRIDLFVLGTDRALHHKRWDGSQWLPSVTEWTRLGGSFVESPVAICPDSNQIHLFCVRREFNGDHSLVWKRWDGSSSPIVDFQYIDDEPRFRPITGVPTVISRRMDLVELFVVLQDGSPAYYKWDGGLGSSWSATRTLLGGGRITSLSVTSWDSGRLDIVGVDQNYGLRHKWLVGSSNWGPSPMDWEDMGGQIAGQPRIASTQVDRLDIIVMGHDDQLHNKHWNGIQWEPQDGWEPLGRIITGTIGALHESDMLSSTPLRQWRMVTPPVPMQAGRIRRIVVLPTTRRLIVACERGVWWSPIPPSSAGGVGYNWQEATGLPDCGFFGLAKGPGESFIAAANGEGGGAGGFSHDALTSGKYGLFRGEFSSSSGQLVMRRAEIRGTDARLMARTSVASCDTNENIVYAVSADPWPDIPHFTDTPEAVSWGSDRLDVFVRGQNSELIHFWWDRRPPWRSENLGGILIGSPRAVSWTEGRLDVFCVGTDRRLYHKRWDGTQWLPSRDRWDALGGTIVGNPAVCVQHGRERIDVFVVGIDGALHHKYRDANGWHPSVHGYDWLGNRIICGSPTAVYSDGVQIHVFVIGIDGTLYHKMLPSMTDWEQLGTEHVLYPVAIKTVTNEIHIFAIGARGNVIRKYLDATGWHPSRTGSWEDLGGWTNRQPTAVADPSNPRIDVFVRGQDNQIHMKSWDGISWNPSGSAWQPRGGNMLGTRQSYVTSAPKAVAWGPGRRDVFVTVGTAESSTLWHLWNLDPSLDWPWEDLSGELYRWIAGSHIHAILRSEDGGSTWSECGLHIPNHPNRHDMRIRGGNFGWHNSCITVKPTNSDTVAIGWRGGPYISNDRGNTWTEYQENEFPDLHGDLQGVRFDETGARLYIASDGGLAMKSDTGRTFSSSFNRQLFTLQFYSISPLPSPYSGGDSIIGALQDNGMVYQDRSLSNWHQWVGGADGFFALTIRTGSVIFSTGGLMQWASWDNQRATYSNRGVIPLTRLGPNDPLSTSGLSVISNTVNRPALTNASNEKMYAIAHKELDLYGAFAPNDGSSLHWEYIGSAPAGNGNITSTSSVDGNAILVGFHNGSIFSYRPNYANPVSGIPNRMNIIWPKDGPGSVERIVMHDNEHAFAICNHATANGYVLRLRRESANWEPLLHGLPMERLIGLDTDWTVGSGSKPMYVATNSRVYVSTDDGDTWRDASNGLPKVGHLSGLRFFASSNNIRYLYVGTYGRSVFRALLS